MKYTVNTGFDKKTGKLVWIPKLGNPVTVLDKKPFALLQRERTRLQKEPKYEKCKGKFKLKYAKR